MLMDDILFHDEEEEDDEEQECANQQQQQQRQQQQQQPNPQDDDFDQEEEEDDDDDNDNNDNDNYDTNPTEQEDGEDEPEDHHRHHHHHRPLLLSSSLLNAPPSTTVAAASSASLFAAPHRRSGVAVVRSRKSATATTAGATATVAPTTVSSLSPSFKVTRHRRRLLGGGGGAGSSSSGSSSTTTNMTTTPSLLPDPSSQQRQRQQQRRRRTKSLSPVPSFHDDEKGVAVGNVAAQEEEEDGNDDDDDDENEETTTTTPLLLSLVTTGGATSTPATSTTTNTTTTKKDLAMTRAVSPTIQSSTTTAAAAAGGGNGRCGGGCCCYCCYSCYTGVLNGCGGSPGCCGYSSSCCCGSCCRSKATYSSNSNSNITTNYNSFIMKVLSRIVFWFTILALTAAVFWYSYELFNHGKEPHLIAWFSAGAFVLLGFPISMYGIVGHLSNYNQPFVQVYVIRILWMVPIYSVQSWLAMRFHKQAIYIETLRDLYESYVLYSFLQFLIQVLGGEHALINMLKDKSPTRGHHMWGMQWCMKPWIMGQPTTRISGSRSGQQSHYHHPHPPPHHHHRGGGARSGAARMALTKRPRHGQTAVPLLQQNQLQHQLQHANEKSTSVIHSRPNSPTKISIPVDSAHATTSVMATAATEMSTRALSSDNDGGGGGSGGMTATITLPTPLVSSTANSMPLSSPPSLSSPTHAAPSSSASYSRPRKVVYWSSPFFINCKFGVLQYVLLKFLSAVAVLLLEWKGWYKEGNFTPQGGYLYICILTNVSQCWALYCLILFYYATHTELSPIRPVGKFLAVKALVFFTWWQSVLISLLYQMDMIPHYVSGGGMGASEEGEEFADMATMATTAAKVSLFGNNNSTNVLGSSHVAEWTPEDVAKGIQDYLICIEMFLAAVVHMFVFPHSEYSPQAVMARTRAMNQTVKWRKRLGRRGTPYWMMNANMSSAGSVGGGSLMAGSTGSRFAAYQYLHRDDRSKSSGHEVELSTLDGGESDVGMGDIAVDEPLWERVGDISGGTGLSSSVGYLVPTRGNHNNSSADGSVQSGDSNKMAGRRNSSGSDLQALVSPPSWEMDHDGRIYGDQQQYQQQRLPFKPVNLPGFDRAITEEGEGYDDDGADDAFWRDGKQYSQHSSPSHDTFRHYEDGNEGLEDYEELNFDEESQGASNISVNKPGFVRALLDSAIPIDLRDNTVGIVKGDYHVERKTLLQHATTSDQYDLFSHRRPFKRKPKQEP